MKAAQINSYGGPEVLKTVDSAEKPKAGPGQVLVEVYAAGVNPFDYKVRAGFMKDFIPLKFPATLGGDVAGVVAELGEGVEGFKIGDEVYGQSNALSTRGSFAEFTPVEAAQLAPKPKSIDFAVAAALPLAGVSAYQALVEHINLQSGQKILIHGGGGGIGSIAIQIAKALGASIATTASSKDLEYVKSLGADEVIDYENQKFEEVLKDYDVVFDTVGGETYMKSYQVLKPGGVLVSMVGPTSADEDPVKERKVKVINQQTTATNEKLSKLTELVDQGTIKVHIDKVFSLDEASDALAYLQNNHPRGKVVIKVK